LTWRGWVRVGAALCFALGAAAHAEPPAAPAPPSGGRTIVLPIEGEIDLGLAPFIQRVLKDATAEDVVILQINTFGGRVDAAVQIRDALLSARAKTVAFIDSRAISAGALISLATDTIVMTHGATIGAATPVTIEGGKMAPVEAKVVSYFRKEMKSTAEAKGRRGDLAEAMVDPAVEIEGLDGKDSTLTLTTTEALKYKVAAFETKTIETLLAELKRPLPSVIRPGLTWAEKLARFLSQGAVSSLLMTLGMLGILIELWAPGHALAGTLGVMCLLLFFFGHYVVQLAGWEEIVLFVAGVLLVVLELAFFPGHGAVAVVGVLCIIGALVMALLNLKRVPFSVSWELGWVTRALAMVFGSLLGTGVAMAFVARAIPSTRFGRPLILNDAITARASDGEPLVGKHGVTDTGLRPSGKATIGGKRIDVVSEGGFIDAGERVVVTRVEGSRVAVRKS
jgi:membrane-bound serine protease (ClpP class)